MTQVPTDEQQPKTVVLSRKDVRRLEDAAKEGKDAVAKLAQYERERAFMAAGVPVDTAAGKLFVRGYEGDATVESIKASYLEVFGNGQGQPAGQQEVVDEELRRIQESGALTAGYGQLPPDRLAERNQKLAALSQTDLHYDEKFNAILNEYGTPAGDMVNG